MAVASVDEAAVDAIAEAQGVTGGLELGEGTVAYSDEITVLGFPIGFSITAEPEAAWSFGTPPSTVRVESGVAS